MKGAINVIRFARWMMFSIAFDNLTKPVTNLAPSSPFRVCYLGTDQVFLPTRLWQGPPSPLISLNSVDRIRSTHGLVFDYLF